MNNEYDVIVIGAGPGGEVAAGRCAEGGLSTAVVERELVGGECSFWGCMPSKTLLRPGAVLSAAQRVPGAREAITEALDPKSALARRDEITNNWDDESAVGWLDARGVALIRGHGRLAGPRTVDVGTRERGAVSFKARRAVVVATGSSPVVPPIKGLRDINTWDNRDVTASKEVPRRLLVLGGGAIGVEMAQAWRRLGSEEVTVVEAAERLLPSEEPFAGAELETAFEAEGIRVLTGVRMVAASRAGGDGPVSATLADGRKLVADEILVSVGRRPKTGDLGLDSVGLEPGRFIEVDDHMRSSSVEEGWLYAIGDVNGRALLTHMAKYQGRVAAEHILGVNTGAAEHDAIPRIIFTDPQVAAVGLTTAEGTKRGLDIRTASCYLGDVAGASVSGVDIRGRVRLVVDAARDVLVGATMVGPDTGDMLHAATIAIVGRVPLDRLRHAVPSFPSLSEVWLKAIENYDASREDT